MKIGIIGQKWLAHQVFDQLRQSYEIGFVAVPDETDRLHTAGIEACVPVVCYKTEGLQRLLDHPVDLLICAHAFVFIPADVRAIASHAIGYHPSLLPLHKGCHSIEDAINAGDRITGGTVYHLTDAMDAGPVAFQDWCFIHEGETATNLWRRVLAPMGVEMLLNAADHLSAYGFLPSEGQEEISRAAA
ncbi:methionyl-tRNA formyltransferase [Agrobacterium vitis]|uniref:Methionyl-tRNA formyltransferase n=1 Tax=Agrobacterium vitis TaxID=373 RepID=A0A6L6VQ63_AGRVI|nr:formyltransferase family protein [Agrobacterium vitis]MUZ76247.1 methionyl-tRNA formyltransferase [Agrobacterium vitis]